MYDIIIIASDHKYIQCSYKQLKIDQNIELSFRRANTKGANFKKNFYKTKEQNQWDLNVKFDGLIWPYYINMKYSFSILGREAERGARKIRN